MSRPQYTMIPRFIGTVAFGSFVANTTIYINYINVLKRNAKQRTFLFASRLDQPTSAPPNIYFFDSAIQGSNPQALNGTPLQNAIGSNGSQSDTSERNGILASHFESMKISLGMGATLPTSGGIDIYVMEVF